MRPLNILSRARIGSKLGVLMGSSVLLVAGMIVNEHFSGATIERLTAAADKQQAIALRTVNTELVLQQVQIASRELATSRTPDQVETIVAGLLQIAADGKARLKWLQEQSNDPVYRDRFTNIQNQFDRYTSTLEEIGSKQSEILTLFRKRDEIASK